MASSETNPLFTHSVYHSSKHNSLIVDEVKREELKLNSRPKQQKFKFPNITSSRRNGSLNSSQVIESSSGKLNLNFKVNKKIDLKDAKFKTKYLNPIVEKKPTFPMDGPEARLALGDLLY